MKYLATPADDGAVVKPDYPTEDVDGVERVKLPIANSMQATVTPDTITVRASITNGDGPKMIAGLVKAAVQIQGKLPLEQEG